MQHFYVSVDFLKVTMISFLKKSFVLAEILVSLLTLDSTAANRKKRQDKKSCSSLAYLQTNIDTCAFKMTLLHVAPVEISELLAAARQTCVPPVCYHQCLDSIRSARRLSLFRVSYPTTMSTDVGVEEMTRADSPLVSPYAPSSTSSCLNVPITDVRPSTLNRQDTSPLLSANKTYREV